MVIGDYAARTNSLCVCGGVRLDLKLLFMSDTIMWGRILILMRCPNTYAKMLTATHCASYYARSLNTCHGVMHVR